MTSFKETGLLVHKGEVKSGKSARGNDWQSMEFRIEVPHEQGEPHYLVIKCLNDRVDAVNDIPLGTKVEVEVNVRSTSWTKDGREMWFTNLDLWKIEAKKEKPVARPVSAPVQDNTLEPQQEDLPF